MLRQADELRAERESLWLVVSLEDLNFKLREAFCKVRLNIIIFD